MAETHRRTAFTAALLLDRRQAPSSSAAAITGVAVDQASQRLFLGLEDGVLEEHAILTGPQGARASLAARKHAAKKVCPPAAAAGTVAAAAPPLLGFFCSVGALQPPVVALSQQALSPASRQAIVGIHHLAAPASGGSRGSLLVLLTEDGVVHLLDGDSLEGAPMPLRCVPSCSRCLRCNCGVTAASKLMQAAAPAALLSTLLCMPHMLGAGTCWPPALRRRRAACHCWRPP